MFKRKNRISRVSFAASYLSVVIFGASLAAISELWRTPLTMGVILVLLVMAQLDSCAKRTHDFDRSGWWAFLLLVPLINLAYLFVLICRRGSAGTNRFGTPPHA